ncbi:MAG: (d)CMP kinase [Acidobacteria bacterium]|nr:(d)CMP kinase [Acidobacteriota bacterium]MCB9399555.1 (d)CMP kinase [Acidobacteriota bacterium]
MTVKQVIALDGPSGVGKSTIAKRLAQELGWTHLDTGALYRAITHAWLEAGADPSWLDQPEWLQSLQVSYQLGKTQLNGRDVSKAIRSQNVTEQVSFVSSHAAVRQQLTAIQRDLAAKGKMILDGRDIGTVVVPDAFLKVFMLASVDERAKRRWLQLGGDQQGQSLASIRAAVADRDHQDETRALAPLKPASDAWILDTDPLSIDQVVAAIMQEVHRRLEACPSSAS